MARRYTFEEPTSRLAIWSRRMAGFALAVLLLAYIIVIFDLLEIRPALAIFGGAVALAGFALLLAFAAFIAIWKDGSGGMSYALTAIGLSLVLVAYPVYLGSKIYRLPWIYDVTTDPLDPPRFVALAAVRPRDANPIAYAGLYAAELQRAAYPDIEPLDADASANAAFNAALAVIKKRKWRIVAEPPPLGTREGRIEAITRTFIMGIRNDIVVRVRPTNLGSRIDVRSSFRYGPHDFGTDATLIRSLMEDIDDAIDNIKPERPAAPPPKKQAKEPKRTQPPVKR